VPPNRRRATLSSSPLSVPLPRGLAAARPAPARWVPVVLAILLVTTSARSWATLRPGIGLLAHASPADLEVSSLAIASSQAASAPLALSPIFTPEVQAWGAFILRWSHAFQIDPNLVATVMQIESCGDPTAVSPSGAAGLFQVMPYHFSSGENPTDPDTNARRGLTYLAQSLHLADGKCDLALAGYNGGHGLLAVEPSGWPSETRRYVYWGAGILDDIRAGVSPSPRLEEWLAAGGARLCRQAARALAGAAEAQLPR
jgi:soluble lytic murein transglycosylase-like protein